MSIDEFSELKEEQKEEAIKQLGTIVGKRDDALHDFLLFQIASFYVEIGFRKEDGTVWRIGEFDHPILLAPYLDQINLEDLLSK